MDHQNNNQSDWKTQLSPEQYKILREGATEKPFTGEYVDHHQDGSYHCAGCGQALFSSNTKFESGSGWPSFWDVIKQGNVKLIEDKSLGMKRTEVKCSKCDGHLGHVFPDGPKDKTGERYCINSAALNFQNSN